MSNKYNTLQMIQNKKKRLSIIITITCLLVAVVANAQDFNFSQYQHTPMNINPAMLSTNDDFEVIANFHQTRLFESLNMQNYQLSLLYPVNITKNDRLPQGVGLTLIHDNTGKQGLLNCTGGSLAFSQAVQVGRSSFLSVGFQASYYFYNNTNPGNYTTGSQWVQGAGFNSSLGINEQINFETVKLFSIGTGVNLHIKDGNSSKGDFGIAFYHLNKPQYSILNDNNRLSTKYIFYGNYRLYRYNEVSIAPRVLFIYQQMKMLSFGTLINYEFKSNNPFLLIKNCNLQLGLDYRNDHTGVVSCNVEQSQYLIGLSYAVAMNSAKVYSNYRSNFELCFAYKFGKNKKRRAVPTEYSIGDTRIVFDRGTNKQKTNEYSVANNYQSDSVVATGDKYKIQLRQDFKFRFNDANLSEDAHQYLDDLANMLKQNSHLKVDVIGHTDDVGTDEANKIISERRARGVIDYLISKGIKSDRLKLTAKGKSEPIFPNDTEENRAKNRRVEFKIYNE
jgi:type IX secretion system PorP/SprF family membrane protein